MTHKNPTGNLNGFRKLTAILLLTGILTSFVWCSSGCIGCSSNSSSSKSYTDAEYNRARKAVIDADRRYYYN